MATPDGELRSISGSVVETSLSSAISDSATSITVNDASTYPAASGNGTTTQKWCAILINEGEPNAEVVYYSPKSGNVFQNCLRGKDGTAAFAHAAGESVKHIHTALDAAEANRHVADDTQDDHSQYVHISVARNVSAVITRTGQTTYKNDVNGVKFTNSSDAEVMEIGNLGGVSGDISAGVIQFTDTLLFFRGSERRMTFEDSLTSVDSIFRVGTADPDGDGPYVDINPFNLHVHFTAEGLETDIGIKHRAKGVGTHTFSDHNDNYWVQIDNAGTDGATDNLSIAVRVGNTLKRISQGGLNSGGTGFRLLRVGN